MQKDFHIILLPESAFFLSYSDEILLGLCSRLPWVSVSYAFNMVLLMSLWQHFVDPLLLTGSVPAQRMRVFQAMLRVSPYR